jgi:hypothetical protein
MSRKAIASDFRAPRVADEMNDQTRTRGRSRSCDLGVLLLFGLANGDILLHKWFAKGRCCVREKTLADAKEPLRLAQDAFKAESGYCLNN